MFKQWWNKHAYSILISICICFLVTLSIINYFQNKKGSYSNSFYYKSKPQIKNEMENSGFTSKLELECKYILENMFQKTFDRVRLDSMKNPITGYNLELDCYNDDLKLGVEIQGIQHYKYTPFFHKNKDKFTIQQYRDEIKRFLCKENDIYLIEIPYNIKIKHLFSFIKKEVEKYQLKTGNNFI